jgi:hypothetical protein
MSVVLYELLTGRKLHVNQGEQLQAKSLAKPSSIYADIPVDLENVVLSALSEDPQARPGSSAEFKEKLDVFLDRWDKSVDGSSLSSFLLEALSGRSAGKKETGFSFGEATSHWFADDGDLVRMTPEEKKAPSGDSEEQPKLSSSEAFAFGTTDMLVRDSGLAKGRTVKILASVILGVVCGVVVWWLLGAGPFGQPETGKASLEVPGAHAGPVQIKTQPEGALVMMDGHLIKPVGSPARFLGLPAGTHQLRLMLPGYQVWEGSIELVKDQPMLIEKTLSERIGTLWIRSTPAKARVYLNGKRMGRTPLKTKPLSAAKVYKLVLKKRRRIVKMEIHPGDWPSEPQRELVIEKTLKKRGKRQKKRRRPNKSRR